MIKTVTALKIKIPTDTELIYEHTDYVDKIFQDFLKDIIVDMTLKICPDGIFTAYMKNNTCYFLQNTKGNVFFYSKSKIYNVLKNKYNLSSQKVFETINEILCEILAIDPIRFYYGDEIFNEKNIEI